MALNINVPSFLNPASLYFALQYENRGGVSGCQGTLQSMGQLQAMFYGSLVLAVFASIAAYYTTHSTGRRALIFTAKVLTAVAAAQARNLYNLSDEFNHCRACYQLRFDPKFQNDWQSMNWGNCDFLVS